MQKTVATGSAGIRKTGCPAIPGQGIALVESCVCECVYMGVSVSSCVCTHVCVSVWGCVSVSAYMCLCGMWDISVSLCGKVDSIPRGKNTFRGPLAMG